MRRIGLAVIIAAIVLIGYFWLKPSPEQETAPTRSIAEQPPSPDVTSSITPEPPGNKHTAPAAPQPLPAPPTDPRPPAEERPEEPHSLFTEFEAQPVDPQWSEENEIRLENYLFANENYSELDIEGIQCKASLCEIRVYEKANTVWARVVHNLATDQGWDLSSWRYADYYDSDGKRLIRTVVGQKPDSD